jgi:hypothetical protein
MSSSSSSSSSSSPSSSHQQPSITPSNVVDIPGPSNTNNNNNDDEFEAPSSSSSSSRQRAMNEVWLEPVVEALATQVAIDSSHYHGRLSAASALAIIFQVTFSILQFFFIMFFFNNS